MSQQNDDIQFASAYNAAIYEKPSRSATSFILILAFIIAAFLTWASWAQIDEVTRGEGRVVPSGKNQVVQSLEGGIVKEIFVKPGAIVKKGDLLLRIDDTGFSSSLGEVAAKNDALRARIIRLRYEVTGDTSTPLSFPDDLMKRAPQTVAGERSLYAARQQSLNAQVGILRERLMQRERDLLELKTNIDRLQATVGLAQQEVKLKAPLAEKGVIPKTDFIHLQRELVDLEGQLSVARKSQPRLEAAIREAQKMIEEQELKFRQDARAELSEKIGQQSVNDQTLRGAEDRVVRTDIRSPVDGIVTDLKVNTVGEVIKSGDTLAQIVPQEKSLSVEAQVRPNDIAFIHPGQKANVKITAYDFSIYGGLEGEVQRISADSTYDDAARQVFYLVTVKTLTNRLGKPEQNLIIIPGMVAQVDILTGKKSVLQYLLKPINKARFEALRER